MSLCHRVVARKRTFLRKKDSRYRNLRCLYACPLG